MIEIRNGDGSSSYIEQGQPQESLLETLQENGIYLPAECNGKGNCARCQVRFLRDAPEPTAKERALLTPQALREGVRLACAVRGVREGSLQIAGAGEAELQVLTEGIPCGSGGRGKDDRTAGRTTRYGVAVDIGTTTLAAVLVRLPDGVRVSVASAVNGQRAFGADVIARIQAANSGKGEELRARIRADITDLLERLFAGADIAPEQTERIVLVGNTTMCHLLRGLSCAGLGAAPFTPEDLSLWRGTAAELLGVPWEAEAVVLPGISAFVGADIVAGIYALGMDRSDSPRLLLDIGTNGEMALGCRDGFLVTSAAAGPVFEGGGLSCGVPGVPGAVSHVRLVRAASPGGGGTERLRFAVETLGGREPVGLCGTGVIDLVGELAASKLIDGNGTLAEPWFTEGVPVSEHGLRFTQGDIRQVQMGKAAIRAGIETLLEEYGRRGRGESVREELTVALAGGFGYGMDVGQAVRIGMIPASLAGRVALAGNSALEGAVRYLCEGESADARLEWIADHATELNLAMQDAFDERYLAYMGFAEI